MTCGMLMTVLARLDGVDTETAPEGGRWYDAGVAWEVKRGVSDGTEPERDITRQEIDDFMYNTTQKTAYAKTDSLMENLMRSMRRKKFRMM